MTFFDLVNMTVQHFYCKNMKISIRVWGFVQFTNDSPEKVQDDINSGKLIPGAQSAPFVSPLCLLWLYKSSISRVRKRINKMLQMSDTYRFSPCFQKWSRLTVTLVELDTLLQNHSSWGESHLKSFVPDSRKARLSYTLEHFVTRFCIWWWLPGGSI